MGLAGSQRKQKLSSDPNNTKWSRNVDSFGQKMLRAQGWQPGDFLGAKDAAHAPWHTKASASVIHVVAKDDNLGIGAKRHAGDQCVGLDAFQDLLGRLNGKSDGAREDERKARDGLRLNLYLEQKVGSVRFVRGGWLEGDEMRKDGDSEQESEANEAVEYLVEEPAVLEVDQSGKKSKKRKAELDEQEDDFGQDKSTKRRRKNDSTEPQPSSKKSKTKKKGENRVSVTDQATAAGAASETTLSSKHPADNTGESQKSNKSKKSKKSNEEKRRSKKTSGHGERVTEKKKRKNKRPGETEKVPVDPANLAVPSPTLSNVTTLPPAGSGCSTPNPVVSSRFLSRKRFIDQKRLALADPEALAQIFMVRS